MDKTTLLKVLSEMLDEATASNLYGHIQIDFVAGQPDLIHKLSTKKLRGEGNSPHNGKIENR